jgi:YfiH family protein
MIESAVRDSTVPRLELDDWADRYGLVAGITTRERGFNLGLWTEEPVGQVMGRWRTFRTAFSGRFPAVILSHQVHGSSVAWHEQVPPGWLVLDGHDGHATADQGVLLTITVADCIPVYLAVPGRAVALVHAGWRGVAGGILKTAAQLLAARSATPISGIVTHCGIGICGKCYEVGSEVATQLTGQPVQGQSHIDLRALLARQAADCGIHQITISGACSSHEHERFFSHRASGGRDGRMVAYLGMPIG